MTLRREAIAPAKLNLALHVVGERPDGRHLLESLAVFTASGDRLSFQPAPHDGLTLSGPFAKGLAHEPANLVIVARDQLRAAFPDHDCPPVAIHLEKNLPLASGIGAGSSDAAMTLKELSSLWQLPVTANRLAELGLQLGADVPMCLTGRPVLASGIGETLCPVDQLPGLSLVLVNPGVPVATGDVFRSLAVKRNRPLPPLPLSPSLADWLVWLGETRNDLEVPAMGLAPDIARVLAKLRMTGAAVARMSGSGATCYGLYSNGEARRAAASWIRDARPDWFVMEAQTEALLPVEQGCSL